MRKSLQRDKVLQVLARGGITVLNKILQAKNLILIKPYLILGESPLTMLVQHPSNQFRQIIQILRINQMQTPKKVSRKM